MKKEQIRSYDANDATLAGSELKVDLRAGDIVLVKGSQGARLEKTVREIMAEPNRAPELVVRMDSEWQNR